MLLSTKCCKTGHCFFLGRPHMFSNSAFSPERRHRQADSAGCRFLAPVLGFARKATLKSPVNLPVEQ